MERISRNAPCPCGSGKKFKQCCLPKGIDYQQDDGAIVQSIPLSPAATAALKKLKQDFIARHGREPGPGDRVFDGAPPLEVVEHLVVEAMKKSAVDPAIIHAYEKTGMMLSEQNKRNVPDKDIDEWNAAIDEYERSTGTKASRRFLNEQDLAGLLANGPK